MFRKLLGFIGFGGTETEHCKGNPDSELVSTASTDSILSVDAFNEWFNDPLNNAVYAHSGIFLRLDKLSYSHIEDYLDKNHNIDRGHPFYNDPMFYLLLCDFQEDIRNDWIQKSK